MGKRQLCWTCAKCTNGNLCEWVKDFIYPAGCIVDDENFITYCDNYEDDKLIDNFKSYAKRKFRISERTYFKWLYVIKNDCNVRSSKFKEFKEEYLSYIQDDFI